MRLLNIHIDNYGKISDFDIDFSENPIVILQENGWGKSTLASFIKVMFYGFEGENRRSSKEKEREHYRPWNKGMYGGSVLFEHKGKEYELNRHFGKKENDDSAQLIDIATNLETKDYSVASLGEEIFGVDRESFVRTLFIGQGNISVHNDKDTIEDGILAKAGRLAEGTGDIGDYESVSSRLRDAAKKLKSGNKFGIINEMTAERSRLENEVRAEAAVNDNIIGEKEQLDALMQQKERIERAESNIDKEYRIAVLAKEYEGYEKLANDRATELETKKNAMEECRRAFKNRVPSKEELAEAENTAREVSRRSNEIRVLKSEMGHNSEGEPIDSDMLAEQTSKVSRFEEISQQLYGEKIRLGNAEENLENAVNKNEAGKQNYEKAVELYDYKVALIKSETKRLTIIFVVLGIITAVMGAIWGLGIGRLLFVCIGLVIAGVAFPIGKAVAQNSVGTPIMPTREEDESLDAYRKEVEEITNNCEMLQREARILERNILDFLERIGEPGGVSDARRILGMLEQRNNAGTQSKQSKEKLETLTRELPSLKEKLISWFGEIGFDYGEDFVESVNRVSRSFELYVQARNYYMEAKQNIPEEKPFTEEEIQQLKQAKSMEELQESKRVLEAEKQRIVDEIQQLTKGLDENLERRDEIAGAVESLHEVNDKLNRYETKYDIISRTADYIDRAKEKLNASYMNPIAEAYRKHYSQIISDGAQLYDVDANINITRREMGEKRSMDSLSLGYRDLVDFSLRMALVDVMYGDEPVFIVLDDPFVNLDSEKMKKALSLIKNPSLNHQIIYFTCHESRMA